MESKARSLHRGESQSPSPTTSNAEAGTWNPTTSAKGSSICRAATFLVGWLVGWTEMGDDRLFK